LKEKVLELQEATEVERANREEFDEKKGKEIKSLEENIF
jgi:hypothetical protein